MAGEAYAGESITGKAGSSSLAYRPKGGGIPVQDIPNLPKTIDMPLAQAQKINLPRYEYEAPVTGMEARAAKMKQEELPGGFAKGASLIAGAAGRGDLAFAKAEAVKGAAFGEL